MRAGSLAAPPGYTGPAGHTGPRGGEHREPAAASPAGCGDGRGLAVPAVQATAADALSGPVACTERAAIGDGLRIPVIWCEFSPCISRRTDRWALGEADARARALAAGWRVDALGRLACPSCQRTDARFRGTRPVVRWERDAAITMVSLMVAGYHGGRSGAGGPAGRTDVIPAIPLPASRGAQAAPERPA